MTRPAHRH